jgi:hypothetical protein
MFYHPMRNPDARLRINWPYIVSIVFISITILGFVAWYFTVQVYRERAQGLPVRGGWSWPAIIALDAGCLATLLALLGKIFRDANTIIGETELSQPRLFGHSRIIRWTEVTSVKIVRFGVHVLSDDEKIILTPYAYSNPAMVMANLRSRVERPSKVGPQS